MMVRTQLALDAQMHKLAKARASELGISLAEYVRRLVARDVARSEPEADPAAVFNLGDSGGSDIARHKQRYLDEAVAADHPAPRRGR
jgi:hypothetical protein